MVAIVTGASRGIGKACAIRLAKDGYTVVINYSHNDAKAQEALDEIKANGGDGMIYKADMSNPEEVNGGFVEFGVIHFKGCEKRRRTEFCGAHIYTI